MAGDLYSYTFGALAGGTTTSDAYDVSHNEVVEIFARAGTAIGTAGGTAVTVHIDAQDIDGNWFSDAAGSFDVGTAVSTVKAYRRGESVGAADPAVLGMKQRVRLVTGGSIQFGINVVGF